MKRKLLFFDIDGTLLTDGIDGYVPESSLYALRKAQENGHLCFINTGRTRSFLPKPIDDFPFDGYVCGCGTDIILHGETAYYKEIPNEICKKLPAIANQAGMQIVAEGQYSCFFENRPDQYEEIKDLYHYYASVKKVEQPVRSFEEDILHFNKFVVLFDDNGDVPLLKELIKDYFYYTEREDLGTHHFAEVTPNGCSKATGIDFLAQHFGASLEDCYVFGDSNNDLSMLEHVPNSIAMGNAFPEVLARTSYITTPIDEDGVYYAMKFFNLI